MENTPREQAKLDLKLTPINSSIEDTINAFEDSNNYGEYLSNARNKRSVEDAILQHFGPSLPVKKRALEKKLGKKFPIKTKQAMDDLIKSLESSIDIVSYEDKGNYILFPSDKNESKSYVKNVIKTVMGNAGIQYKIQEFEDLSEYSEKKRMQEIAGIKKIKK